MTFCLLHLPDIICFYRILASIIALLLGPHPATPWLFSTALISDLFDGYIFRKYVKDHPNWRYWCPLPISLDMVGDLLLILCGIVYACLYLYKVSLIITLISVVAISILALTCVVLPNLVPPRHAKAFYVVCYTLLTHFACLLMLHAAIAAWIVYSPLHWFFYASFTIALFYYIFAHIGDPARLIRRPPANFRRPS